MSNPMFAAPGTMELLIILAIVVLVFGASKLPELARGTGQALRIFKTETKGLKDDDDKPTSAATDAPVALPSSSGAGSTAAAPIDPIVAPDVEPDIPTHKNLG